MREDVKERVCKHCEKNETCKEKDHIRELIYTIEHYGAELNVEVKRRTQKKCMCATQYINAVLDTYKNEKQNIMWKKLRQGNYRFYSPRVVRPGQCLRKSFFQRPLEVFRML